MAELLTLQNFPELNIVERTKVSSDAAAAQAVVNADNAQGIAANAYTLIGVPGSDKAEIRKVSSVATNAITMTANFTFAHAQFEPLVKLRGNQIKVYRAANVDGKPPVDADFSSIATVTIEGDQLFTFYTDSSGGSDYWYKQTFYDDVAATETSLSDSPAVRGGDFGHYATIDEVRTEAGFQNNVYITDQNIYDRREDAESEVKSALYAAGYSLPLPTDIPTPSVVKNATKLLAAGYLLLQDYGTTVEGTNKEGNAKIKMGRDLLDRIKSRDIVLVDITEAAVDSSNQGIRMWPDATTADAAAEDAGSPRKFRMSDVY